MTVHPIEAVLVDAARPIKEDVRQFARASLTLVLPDAASAAAMDLPETLAIQVGGVTYAYDAADTTSAAVAGRIIVSNDGRRYKIAPLPDKFVTNAQLADMAQATFKGRAAAEGTGAPVDLTATQARTILNIDGTLDADKPLSAPAISRIAQFERTVHSLCGYSDPAEITAARVSAALTANPTIRLLKYLDYDYSHSARISILDRDLTIDGAGKAATRIKWTGATSGFGFAATDVTADRGRAFDVLAMRMHSMVAGAYGVDAAWNCLPFSLHNFGDFDLDFSVENSAASFERMVRLKHAQGTRVYSNMQNHRATIAGAGIEYQGFCLANKVEWLRAGYHAVSLLVSPFPVQKILVSGRVGNFPAGEPVTTSGGATGLIVGSLSADEFVVEVLTGTFTATHTITSGSGGTATISTVQLREWGSEGYYFGDMEFVGCQNGLRVENTEKIAKPGVLIQADRLHVNGTAQPIYVAFCSQVKLDVEGYTQTAGTDAATIVSCQRVEINGSLTNLTGGADDGTALRVVVGDPTYGSNACDNIQGHLDVIGYANEDVVDGGVTNYSVTFGPLARTTAFIPTVTAQTPGSTPPTIAATDCRFEYLSGKLMFLSYDIQFSSAGVGNSNAVMVTLPPGVTLARRACLHGNEQGFNGAGIWARNEWPSVTLLGVAFSHSPGTSLWNDATRLVFSGVVERA